MSGDYGFFEKKGKAVPVRPIDILRGDPELVYKPFNGAGEQSGFLFIEMQVNSIYGLFRHVFLLVPMKDSCSLPRNIFARNIGQLRVIVRPAIGLLLITAHDNSNDRGCKNGLIPFSKGHV